MGMGAADFAAGAAARLRRPVETARHCLPQRRADRRADRVSTVSTGKPGHETPTGVFTILQKDAKHRSSKYNNAPMPFQQRLTWGGVALHAGGLPGYPESHGCVHLPFAFAKALFETTGHATTLIIAGNAAHPVSTGSGDVLAPSDVDMPDTGFWNPKRSASGPVTIVMSRSDQALIVLRNGVEIGRSPIALDQGNDATHVLTLTEDAGGQPAWVFAGVSGHRTNSARQMFPSRTVDIGYCAR